MKLNDGVTFTRVEGIISFKNPEKTWKTFNMKLGMYSKPERWQLSTRQF